MSCHRTQGRKTSSPKPDGSSAHIRRTTCTRSNQNFPRCTPALTPTYLVPPQKLDASTQCHISGAPPKSRPAKYTSQRTSRYDLQNNHPLRTSKHGYQVYVSCLQQSSSSSSGSRTVRPVYTALARHVCSVPDRPWPFPGPPPFKQNYQQIARPLATPHRRPPQRLQLRGA